MNRLRLASLTLALLVAAVPTRAESPDAAKLKTAFDDIDRLFTTFAAEGHVPGAAWG